MITNEARRAAHDSRAQERGTCMITKEAIEAACAALNKRDRGNAISIPDVGTKLYAAINGGEQ